MKKQLLAGTALVAAAMLVAGGAMAQDKMKKPKMMKPSISVGGFVEQRVYGILDREQTARAAAGAAQTSTELDTSAIDVRSDTEIVFRGSATLDSGVKISALVEVEGAASKDGVGIDESWLAISGSFGKISLGAEDNAADQMTTRMWGSFATDVGESTSIDATGYVPSVHSGGPTIIQHPHMGRMGDANMLSYISPKFGGFQIGMSYIPEQTEGSGKTPVVEGAGGNEHDGVAGAVTYGGKFGEVGISLGAAYTAMQGSAGTGNDDYAAWGIAGSLDFGGGFRVAAGYKRTDEANSGLAGHIVTGGVRYVQGANQFSLGGNIGEYDDNSGELRAGVASYARGMGPGVKIHLNLVFTDSTSNDGLKESRGVTGVTGIKVSF